MSGARKLALQSMKELITRADWLVGYVAVFPDTCIASYSMTTPSYSSMRKDLLTVPEALMQAIE